MQEKEMHTGRWVGNLNDGYHLEDLDIDGRVVLKWILKKQMGVVHWINLAHKRKKFRPVVSMATNIRIP
jgi:hypothetical protein